MTVINDTFLISIFLGCFYFIFFLHQKPDSQVHLTFYMTATELFRFQFHSIRFNLSLFDQTAIQKGLLYFVEF